MFISTTLETLVADRPGATATHAGRLYYRLTPDVWAWVCRAMRTAAAFPRLPGDRATLLARFERLRRWVEHTYPPEVLESALARREPLPRPSTTTPPAAPQAPQSRQGSPVPDVTADPTALALEHFSAALASSGDVPDFATGPVVLRETPVYLVHAPGWLPPGEGSYLSFTADEWSRIQAFRQLMLDLRAKRERDLTQSQSGKKAAKGRAGLPSQPEADVAAQGSLFGGTD